MPKFKLPSVKQASYAVAKGLVWTGKAIASVPVSVATGFYQGVADGIRPEKVQHNVAEPSAVPHVPQPLDPEQQSLDLSQYPIRAYSVEDSILSK